MLHHEGLELRGDLGVESEREVGLDAAFERKEAELLHARDLDPEQVVVGEVGECRTTPEREGVAEPLGGLRGPAVRERAGAVGNESLEASEVDPFWLNHELVPSDARRNDSTTECLSQVGDVAMDDVPRRGRRITVPNHVRESLGGDDLVRPREQHRE